MMKLKTLSFSIALALSATALSGCGGSNNNNNTTTPTPTDNSGTITEPTWTAGQFAASDTFQHQCETPRTGTDPYENAPYPDKAGTAMHEKMWLRSFSNETYLWYDEVEDKDPKHPDFDSDEQLDTVAKYFRHLKTDAVTESGEAKDKYHYSESYDDFKKEAESGLVSGYGVRWAYINLNLQNGPRVLKVAFTQDGSPASQAGLLRGDTITAINGVDINTSTETDKLNAGLLPKAGETHSFTVKRDNVEEPITFSLTATDVQSTPVQNAKIIEVANKKVGYVQFNQFIKVGQAPLIEAFNQFANENVDELVLDMRYNGGGLVAMSAQLGYMVAGEEQSKASDSNNAKVFSSLIHNDKRSDENEYYPFVNRAIDWDAGKFTNNLLPSVNLDTVYILSSSGTCSASESLINGLRGINVKVVLIGGQTCGKPYGFTPEANCGEVYYTVQFKGANAKDFGDYAEGFKPVPETEITQSTIGLTDKVPGCTVADDFANQLGDSKEGMLAAALTHIETGNCPVSKQSVQSAPAISVLSQGQGIGLSTPYHPMRDGLVDIKVKKQ
jgi:C-terminal processing protease CtpA/Prc